jgi:Putative prokaryotic signal transducing protein
MSVEQGAEPELVDVFDTQQESEAQVVHGLLTSAGIESVVASLEAPQSVLPGVGGVVVRVNAEQADEARKLIEDYKNAPVLAEEAQSGEEPAA